MAPKHFDLTHDEASRSVLLRRLADLRQLLWTGGDLTIDFSNTEKMYAEGTLLFLAELRRLIKHSRNVLRFTCVPPLNSKVSQVLQQIGVFDLLGAKAGETPQDEDVVNWRFAHGNKVDGARYEDVMAEYDGAIAVELQERLFAGITEAMTNVINHAYDFPRADGLGIQNSREWWMFSQARDGRLGVSFTDLGAGIPRTLPEKRPNVWRHLLRFGRPNDSRAIAYAIQDSISRTELEHRGKGLGQIVRAIDNEPESEMGILSNHGLVFRKAGRTKRRDYRDSIMGTMIWWVVPLPERSDDDNGQRS